MLTPFERFCSGLHQVQGDFNATLNEMLAFAEIMARKKNSVELDENGVFYVTAAGQIEEVIETLQKHLSKLQRIKKQKDLPY